MDFPGPFPVGRYARKLEEEMKKRARVQLLGEVTGVGRSKKQAFFELRDREGAVPCTMWLDDLEKADLPEGALRDGAELVISGGPDYYRGAGHASPSFSFRASHARLAGEGDLIARLEALRKQLRAEGLFELQKQLGRPQLPKAIGVVTAEAGAARRDLVAGLRRRGWGGTVIWAFAPVQDRHAAPAIAAALQALAARPEVEAIVVARGGGSLADLWAFCDETLCRTVALLRVPVISAIGHERDATLLDDVAAVSCSTPTHAAEAAVPLDCELARRDIGRAGYALQRERGGLNQKIREIRAASERGLAERGAFQRRIATIVLERARRRGVERAEAAQARERRRGAAIERSAERSLQRRREALRRAAVTLRAHDPERTLERGYALAESAAGEPVTSAEGAVAAGEVRLRFADGRVRAEIEGEIERETR
jgi:exodeoxyribonuclease VII large subunit